MAGRQLPKEQSSIISLPLDNPDCRESIRLLQEVCSSCVGPSGHTKMIHNRQGGHVTVTSASSRLLRTTYISKPILKLVNASVQSHLEKFLDRGLLTAVLCLNLLDSFLKTDIHRNLIHNSLHLLLNESLEYLSSDQCDCKFRINLKTTQHLVRLTKSILSSKPLCQFNEDNLSRMSRQIVELFLSTVNSSGENTEGLANHGVTYIILEGYPLDDTCILDGLLFETPYIPVYRKRPLDWLRVQSGVHQGQLKVVLVDVSLAGDTEDLPDVQIEVTDRGSLADGMLRRLKALAQHWIKTNVGLIACQKVIHPQIKRLLESQGVLVMQRLGSLYTDYFSVLAGAGKCSSLDVPSDERHVGYLSGVRHCVYGERSFVHLQPVFKGRVSNVVLCNRTEEAAEETKVVFQSALHALHLSMSEPYCLFGGGCWQTHLAQYITDKMETTHTDWEKELSTKESTLREITGIFTQCLRKSALQLSKESDHLADTTYHHHWKVPTRTFPGSDEASIQLHGVSSCACGLVAYKDDLKFSHLHKEVGPSLGKLQDTSVKERGLIIDDNKAEIIDCYSSTFSAVQVAVSTAAAVISIRNIIQQK